MQLVRQVINPLKRKQTFNCHAVQFSVIVAHSQCTIFFSYEQYRGTIGRATGFNKTFFQQLLNFEALEAHWACIQQTFFFCGMLLDKYFPLVHPTDLILSQQGCPVLAARFTEFFRVASHSRPLNLSVTFAGNQARYGGRFRQDLRQVACATWPAFGRTSITVSTVRQASNQPTFGRTYNNHL
eukprot:1137528-Pelagomonas_calceolata.AAC.1